ncbi:MAG TPA: PLP-dependent aminotransferase family protein [Tepidisphaeraceae bacterium]|jgi:2-aminoadipate transaminase|nr:PLP-dependent aminotransferase family protein [Tepidisphaeraceae bacterium]
MSSATLPILLSEKARRTREQPISYLITTALRNPHLINFAAGLVDASTLPVAETRAITGRILSDTTRGRSALQYDTTAGLSTLRAAALEHMAAMEGKAASAMGLTSDDLLVTTGSQQALYLVGDALIDLGDIVIAANPSYFVYSGTLSSLGAKVMTVPMDADGMNVDAVEALLTRLEADGRIAKVKLIYCTSYFQNPTGLTLSAERRPRLYELAKRFSKRHRILILEDAAYRELVYDGDALPSIKSYDTDNRHVVISHTFSKPFAPGLKLGYSAMPHDLLHAVAQQKGNHDFGSANLTQHIALESLRDGSYLAHGHTLRDAYRKKRDAMTGALDRYLPKAAGLHRTHPHGGLYVWLTLPVGINTSRDSDFFRTAVERGVLYVPGDYCFQPDEAGHTPTNHLRLSFGQVPIDQIDPGIKILADVIAGALSSNPQSAEPSR